MKYLTRHRLRRMAIGSFVALMPLALGGWSRPTSTAPDAQALLAQAIHNTNTVRTLVHTDKSTLTTKDGTVAVTARGEEDEVQNRERDYESVTVRALGQNGKIRTLHYTVNIIFMNGQTYYRSSLSHNRWRVRPGTVFPDPFTGGWRRGRTKVSFPSSAKFVEVGGASSGETHMRTTYNRSSYRVTQDLWISAGTTPYVVREDQTYEATKGSHAKAQTQTSLGPFNQPMNIQPPTIGT